ncbi:MAG: hypothetical protein INF12_14610 [Methylobacterium sp.]|nr:hypothetical protein [Methylobacterium sp.]
MAIALNPRAFANQGAQQTAVLSRPFNLVAPVGGWNAQDALADMPETDAVILDNWFPQPDKVRIRPGYASWATGMTGNVESLIPYTPLSGTPQMFGFNGTSAFNVTGSGAVGAAVLTGLADARWQGLNIGTAGGQFLFIWNENGNDTPRTWNGATWASTTITGPTVANIAVAGVHQRRLWVFEKNSLTGWYGAANAIGGAFNSFSLAGIAKLGGSIVGMESWSRDAYAGPVELCVFFTSEGEVIIYSGTDPASAGTWSLLNVFRLGRPIGSRFTLKAGPELIAITQNGFVPLSTALVTDVSQMDNVAISAKINPAATVNVGATSATFGWQPIIYPRGNMIIFNAPQTTSGQYYQYVANTLTRAWCRFTGINAVCWGLLGNNLFFGGTDGRVYRFDDVRSDNGANIAADALQAFSYFKSPGVSKAFKLVEPVFEANGAVVAALNFNVDFKIRQPTAVAVSSAISAGTWDSVLWDAGIWGGDADIYRGWRSAPNYGRAGSLRIRISSNTLNCAWISTNFTWVAGGQL